MPSMYARGAFALALAELLTISVVIDHLTNAVQVTGLDTKLNDPTAMMTVFVPINSAFDALAQQLNTSVPTLLTQTDMLTQVMLPACLLWEFSSTKQMHAER